MLFFVRAGSECNSLQLTFDGVDRMGERLSEEVLFSDIFIFSSNSTLKSLPLFMYLTGLRISCMYLDLFVG